MTVPAARYRPRRRPTRRCRRARRVPPSGARGAAAPPPPPRMLLKLLPCPLPPIPVSPPSSAAMPAWPPMTAGAPVAADGLVAPEGRGGDRERAARDVDAAAGPGPPGPPTPPAPPGPPWKSLLEGGPLRRLEPVGKLMPPGWRLGDAGQADVAGAHQAASGTAGAPLARPRRPWRSCPGSGRRPG